MPNNRWRTKERRKRSQELLKIRRDRIARKIADAVWKSLHIDINLPTEFMMPPLRLITSASNSGNAPKTLDELLALYASFDKTGEIKPTSEKKDAFGNKMILITTDKTGEKVLEVCEYKLVEDEED